MNMIEGVEKGSLLSTADAMAEDSDENGEGFQVHNLTLLKI
jgi:hypothetical protein